MDHIHEDDPTDHLSNQFSHFVASDQWERAYDVLMELLRRDSLSPYYHYQAGMIALQLKKFQESEHHLRKAISFEPDDADHHQGMAYLRTAQERFLEAEDHCRKALELAPDEVENWILMGDLCRAQSDKNQAKLCLQKAREMGPGSADVLRLAADIETLEEDTLRTHPDDKLENYQKVLAQDPENEFALYSSGAIYQDFKSDYVQAEHFFRAALRQSPHDKDYQKALISTCRNRDPILRLLWLPIKLGIRIGLWCVFIIPYMYFRYPESRDLIGYVSLGLLLAFLFWPITKIYEALTISEVHQELGIIESTNSRLKLFHALPYGPRITIFLAISLSTWTLIAWFLTNPNLKQATINSTGILATISFLGVLLFLLFHSLRSLRRESKRASRNAPLFDQDELK